MQTLLTDTLTRMQIGTAQRAHNLTIYPLLATSDGGPDYMTMSEALSQGILTITEINPDGSVSSLRALNTGDKAVLGLDGEELRGAKQNRVLNTTIVIAARSELVIPVSCTEQGRWASTSSSLVDSNVVMSPKIRQTKMRSVGGSLKSSRQPRSDQHKLWDLIHKEHVTHEVLAQTGAMRDTYKVKASDLEKYLPTFEPQQEQCGLLAFVNGKAVGCDLLSRPDAYGQVHSKLVKSYALDALAEQNQYSEKQFLDGAAQNFIARAQDCSLNVYEAVGLGTDVRLESPTLIGAAVVVEQTVVHLVLFSADPIKQSGNASSYRRRRRFGR